MNIFGIDERSVILDDPAARLCITADTTPGEEMLEFFSRLRFGNGGLEYRRLGIDEQLARLPSPVYLSLELDGRLAGSYVLATRKLESRFGEVEGIYRGLLGIDPDARSSGLGRRLVSATLDWIDTAARRLARPVVSWGCIEAGNRHSLELLSSLGADRIGDLESLTVFRQWPRRRLGIETAGSGLAAAIEQGLAETFADCALRPSGGTEAGYWAVTDDRGIVAGARATLTRVDMSPTGSAWEKALYALFRLVPPARRRFDPRNFTYLRLSDIIVRKGAEPVWRDFLPTLLAEHDAYMAMFLLDPSSLARERLETARVFGRLTARTRQQVAVLGHTWGLGHDDRTAIGSHPLAIGPLDL